MHEQSTAAWTDLMGEGLVYDARRSNICQPICDTKPVCCWRDSSSTQPRKSGTGERGQR